MCPCGTFLVCANQMRFFPQINPDFKKLPPVVKRYLQLWKEEISSSIWRPRPIPLRSNTNGPKMETVAVASQNCQRHCLNPGKDSRIFLNLKYNLTLWHFQSIKMDLYSIKISYYMCNGSKFVKGSFFLKLFEDLNHLNHHWPKILARIWILSLWVNFKIKTRR